MLFTSPVAYPTETAYAIWNLSGFTQPFSALKPRFLDTLKNVMRILLIAMDTTNLQNKTYFVNLLTNVLGKPPRVKVPLHFPK